MRRDSNYATFSFTLPILLATALPDYNPSGTNDNTHVTGGSNWPGAYSARQGAYSPAGVTPTGGGAANACLKVLPKDGSCAHRNTDATDVFTCTQCKEGFIFEMYYPGCKAGPCTERKASTPRTAKGRAAGITCVDADGTSAWNGDLIYSHDSVNTICTKVQISEIYLKVAFSLPARQNHFLPYSGHDDQAIARCLVYKQTYCQRKNSGISVGTTSEASNQAGQKCTSKNQVTCLEVCKLKANGDGGYHMTSAGIPRIEGCSSAGCNGVYGKEACDQAALME